MQLSTLLALLSAANLALAAPANTHKRTPSPFFLDITGLIEDAASGTTDTYASIKQELAEILSNIVVKRAPRSDGGEEGGAAADVVARRANGDSETAGWPLR